MKFLQEHTHLDAVASGGRYIDKKSNLKDAIPLAEIFNKDLYTNDDCVKYKENTFKYGFGGPLMQSILFKFDTIYNIKFAVGSVSDDYCFLVRYLSKDYRIGYINKSLWKYRIHSNNTHKTTDYTYVVLDVIHRFIPQRYKKTAFFNQIFMNAVYQFFYHKNRVQGIRYFIFAMTYLNIDSIKYFSKKALKGFQWIWKNR